MNLQDVKISYSGGRGGWKGDVPVIKLDNSKIFIETFIEMC